MVRMCIVKSSILSIYGYFLDQQQWQFWNSFSKKTFLPSHARDVFWVTNLNKYHSLHVRFEKEKNNYQELVS